MGGEKCGPQGGSGLGMSLDGVKEADAPHSPLEYSSEADLEPTKHILEVIHKLYAQLKLKFVLKWTFVVFSALKKRP